MQLVFSWLAKLQRVVIPRKILITRTLGVVLWFVLLGWLTLSYLYSSGRLTDVALLLDIGRKLGTISFFLYVLTLIPGLLRRLRIAGLMPVMTVLMLFRRQFGVLMFVTASVHQSFTTILPYLVVVNFDLTKFPPPLLTLHLTGLAAWWLLLPLWLTSNDVAVKKLGKWWKILHKLTYVALFFIMIHVALVNHWIYALLLGLIVVGNVWGLIRK